MAYAIYYTTVKCNLYLYAGSLSLLLKADQWLKAPDDKTRLSIGGFADESTLNLKKVTLRFSNTGTFTISFMGETNTGWWSDYSY